MSLADEQARLAARSRCWKHWAKPRQRSASKLGESLASIQKFDNPAENVTTSSLEALQAYSLGIRHSI